MKSIFKITMMSLLLISCGSNENSISASSESLTVLFIDSPVANLNYKTSGGISTVTGSDGSLTCIKGETITFTVGATTLGTSICGNPQVYPTDLTGEDKSDMTNASVAQRMVLLLTSLDSDADPTNGISIPEAAKASVPEIVLKTLADGEVLTFINNVRTNASAAMTVTQSSLANVSALATALTASATHLSSSVSIYDSLGFRGMTLYSSTFDGFITFSNKQDFFGTTHILNGTSDYTATELTNGCGHELLTFNNDGTNKGKVSRILDTAFVEGLGKVPATDCTALYNSGNPILEVFSVASKILTIGTDTYCVDNNKDKTCD
jgi:hypothetical protein